MRQTITIIFLFVCLSACSQSKSLKDSAKVIHQDFNEEQMAKLYSLLSIAKQSDLLWNSNSVTTWQATSMTKFADSLISVYQDQSYVWHRPAPPVKTPMERFEDSVKASKNRK